MINSTFSTPAKVECSKNNPYLARIKERYCLNKNGKRTFHVVLDLQGKELDFKPGDSIGVLPDNDHALVKEYLDALKGDKDALFFDKKKEKEYSLETHLRAKANLTRTSSQLVKVAAKYTQDAHQKKYLETLLQEEQREALHAFLKNNEPLDLILDYLQGIFSMPIQEILDALSPLLPRFYSIASSSLVHKNEIHLTVALSSHEHKGKNRLGVASHFLVTQAESLITPIPIFVQKAVHFQLPEDSSIPLILVGPGTGVAPYKAFIEERAHLGASGKIWLFFGERNEKSDFFYEEFFKAHEKTGLLRITTAFSRDQAEKIYVQHRLYEHRKELYEWLKNGAIFYVCGSASPMAKDVELTFLKILQEEENLDEHGARERLKHLRKEMRYLTDVY